MSAGGDATTKIHKQLHTRGKDTLQYSPPDSRQPNQATIGNLEAATADVRPFVQNKQPRQVTERFFRISQAVHSCIAVSLLRRREIRRGCVLCACWPSSTWCPLNAGFDMAPAPD